MSNALEPLSVVGILDPRLAFERSLEFGVLKSGRNITYTTETSTSYSDTAISINTDGVNSQFIFSGSYYGSIGYNTNGKVIINLGSRFRYVY